jgi:hypothetical protein
MSSAWGSLRSANVVLPPGFHLCYRKETPGPMIRACLSSCLFVTALFLLESTPSAQAKQEALHASVEGRGKDPATISLMRGKYPVLPSYVECIRQLEKQGKTLPPYQLNLDYIGKSATKIEAFGASLSEVNVLLQFAGFGYQMIGAENINGWTNGSFDNVARGFTTSPQFDTDNFFMNYIGHPYMGSTFYLIARNRGLGIFGSWLVSTCGSLLWEYFYEAFYEIPSATDLLVTSNVGTVIGELSWQAKQALVRSNAIERRRWKEVLIFAVDPWNTVSGWLNVGPMWAIDRASINPYNSPIPFPYLADRREE